MLSVLQKKKTVIFIILLTLIGTELYFFNINWGAPYYFHPDERNIASAVSQLQFPNQMNPHFFAYGSFPIYVIYFTSIASNYISRLLQISAQSKPLTATFEQAILVGRAYSASFALILIPLLFLLGRRLRDETTGILAAFFATSSVCFIQFAHFGTFEMWLTFFSVLLYGICLNYFYNPNRLTVILMAFISGILVAVKVTSLSLLPIPLVLIGLYPLLNSKKSINNKHIKIKLIGILTGLKNIALFILISALVYIITNPFVFLDQKDFLSSMHYESSVALGTEPVFYTENFTNTLPFIYQLTHVYPFLINPLLLILFFPAFVYILFVAIKNRNIPIIILVFFFLILLTSQAFLYVKWTRYMVSTIPFIYIIIALFMTNKKANDQMISIAFNKSFNNLFINFILLVSTIFAFSYFKTAFINPDTRISALLFAQRVIPLNISILSEPSDMGVVPFQDAFPHLNTFNFYDLDNNSSDATESQLQQKIASAQYIILPSQRILQSRIENPTIFPKGYFFYKTLLNGQLGFHKIYETPCDIFCKITYLNDPVYWWEQTVTVFDRPTVFIFKKNT